MYYALYDAQCKRYLDTGLNSTSIDRLFNDFLNYLQNSDSEESEETLESFRKVPEELFNSMEFIMEKSKVKFKEEEL